jgi:DNA polymerase III sliding clamp (beta) subunit (PCNA family)
MIINKNELLQALETVKPGLSDKNIIEQSTSFAFLKEKVVTYNNELSISSPLANCKIEGAIKADKLYAFLGKIKKDELDLSIKGNEVILTTGKAKAGLPLQSEITLPLEEVDEKKKWHPIPENFIKFLSFAMASCSKSQATPVLQNVHVTKDGKIEASDNYRMVQCTLKEGLPVKDFLILARSAVEVVKLQPTQISEGKAWVHFKTEKETVISCRIVEDKFPNIPPLLKVEGETIVFPKTIEEVLDRAMVFSKREKMLDESITITLAEKRLKIRAESDSGWFEEDLNMNYKGQPLKINVTPYLLKGIISETLECVTNGKLMKFVGDGWCYVTALRGQ